MNQVILGIGGNLGKRELFLAHTRSHVAERIGHIVASSSIYETDAWGMDNAPAFLNQVIMVETDQSPEDILRRIREIERMLGRKRIEGKTGYSSRTADIDILFYNDEVIHTPHLEVPHPGIADRRFVLIPLNEITSDFEHPLLKRPMNAILAACTDTTEVRPWTSRTAT